MSGPVPTAVPLAAGRRVGVIAPADSYRLGAHLRAAAVLGAEAIVITDRPVGIGGSAIVVDWSADD